ncbi:MAG: tRNA (guanosine(37)-N1)-methyltransferase TrmD [bacterium]|nr:tRNA (guanosine(37)-N1)-methyltransferase TrmD [bacterium]
MTIDVLTLFQEMFTGVISSSIIKRAVDDEKVTINLHNFRDFSKDIHHKVDDTPYGGGCGMILACQPIFDCVNSLRRENSKVILLTPDGTVYNQKIAGTLSKEEHLILICGHYEGFDERIRSICDMELSIGDYVLTGGEVPAMVLIDSITRLLDGVINKESYENDSFYQGLLDYPQYTKPRVYNGIEVPEVLLSGNHQKIAEFRKVQALERTKLRRPDLLKGDINNGNL